VDAQGGSTRLVGLISWKASRWLLLLASSVDEGRSSAESFACRNPVSLAKHFPVPVGFKSVLIFQTGSIVAISRGFLGERFIPPSL
jgi:hypothetical protein